jgi:hypothetical protein
MKNGLKMVAAKLAGSGIALLATMLLAGLVFAVGPSGGDFVVSNSTVDGGGGRASGGDFVLTGTIGQPDASTSSASGGDFAVAGGFWGRVGEVLELIFKDGFETP